MKHICYHEMNEVEKGPDRSPDLLIVGTFNPDIEQNSANWYYGREINEFWFLLPRMLGKPSLHPADIEQDPRPHHEICREFCKNNNIVLIDLIKDTNCEISGFTDKEICEKAKDPVFFNYEKAFEKIKPKKVIFTWKSKKNNLINNRKKEFILYLKKSSIRYCEMPSSSPLYRKGRKAKLDEWRQLYQSILNS